MAAAPPGPLQQRIDYRIRDLPELPAGIAPGGLIDAVYDYATDTTYRRPAALGGGTLAANAVRGAMKIVRFRNSGLNGVPADASTLDRLSANTLCVGNEAVVLNPAQLPALNTEPPKKYVLARLQFNEAGSIQALLDADPATTTTAPCIWLAIDDPNAVGPTIPYLDRNQRVYAGDTVKYFIGDALRLFAVLQDLDPELFPGTGPMGEDWIPEPQPGDTGPYYEEVSPDSIGTTPALLDIYTNEVYNALDVMGGSGQALLTDQLYRVVDAVGGPVFIRALGAHALYPFAARGAYDGTFDVTNGVFTPRTVSASFAGLTGAPVDNALLASALLAKQDSTGWHSKIVSGTVAIGTGSKSTTIGTGLMFRAGDRIRIASGAGWVEGPITSYNNTTGALAFTVAAGDFAGSGTLGSSAPVGPGFVQGSGGGGAAIDDSTGGNSSTTTSWSGSKSNTQVSLKLNTGANTGLSGTGEVFSTVDATGQFRRAAATSGSANAAYNRTTGTTTFTPAGTTSADIAWQVNTPGGSTLLRARGDGVLEILGAGALLECTSANATISFVVGAPSALSFQASGSVYLSFTTSSGGESVNVYRMLIIDRGVGYPWKYDQANGAPQVTGAVATVIHSISLAAATSTIGRRLRLRFQANAETADCLRVVAAEADLTIVRDTSGAFTAMTAEGGTTPTVTNRKNTAAAGAGGFSVVLNTTTNTVDIVWTGEAGQTYNLAINITSSQR